MKRRNKRIVLIISTLVILLLSACQPILLQPISNEEGSEVTPAVTFTINATVSYGQFNGVEYLRHTGSFVRTGADIAYNVPFEVVAPADPAQRNGKLLVEPYHFAAVPAGSRELWLTPNFLFNQGFSHAGVCWEPSEDPNHPCAQFEGKADSGMQIIADFTRMFKTGKAETMVRQPDYLYSIGFSNSTFALFPLLNSPLGEGLFDLSFIVTTGWPGPTPMDFRPPVEDAPPHMPSEKAGKVMLLLTEADIILWGSVLRDDQSKENYRTYEVAGAAHIPAPILETTGIDWTPVLRALFIAGDQWVTVGTTPPSSVALETTAVDSIDPVYDRFTGIARDEDLNALGGIRLPDIAVGRGQFLAVDVEEFVLTGRLIDLKCDLRPDGTLRFADHEAYVNAFEQQAQQLVADRFLLLEDAERLITQANASDVGTVDGCSE